MNEKNSFKKKYGILRNFQKKYAYLKIM